MKSATCFFNGCVVGLALCVSTFRAHSQTGEKHKPDTKLWKSEKAQGETAFKNRQMDEAETHFKAALAEAENFDAHDYRLAESLTELGDFYTRVNRFADAEPLLQRAATIRRSDPSPLMEANVNFLLGFTCIQLRHDDDAEKAFLRAKELYSRKSGPDSPSAVHCMYYLGVLYDEQHDYAKAEPLLKRSASLFEHPATRLKMHNVNDPAANAGSDVWISHYRPDYLYAMEAQARLGGVYSAEGKFTEAETTYKQLIATLEKTGGDNKNLLVQTLHRYADLLRKTNRNAEAAAMETRAKKIQDEADK